MVIRHDADTEPCDDCELRAASARADAQAYPWDQCISDQLAKYGSQETAEKICGSIKAKYGDAKIALRFDTAVIDVSKLARLPAGGVRIDANISRTGIQEYRRPDGTIRREYRPPSEVFSADSLASLPTVPVTRGHPQEVTPGNWRTHAVGQVSESAPRRDAIEGEDFVVSPLLVHDGSTIDDIGAGKLAEISAGYAVVLDETPGVTPSGERYDAVQRGIRFNHVALLPPGGARAGRAARLRLDANRDILFSDSDDQHQEAQRMKKITLDGVEYTEGSPEHIAALNAKLDAAKKADAERAAKLDSVNAEIAKLREDTSDTAIDRRADELAKFRERAKKVLPKGYDFAGKSRAQVRRDALAELKVETKDRDDAWCEVYFDARIDALPAGHDYNRSIPADDTVQAGTGRRDAKQPPEPGDFVGRRDAADDAFIKRLREPYERGRVETRSQYESLQGRKEA